jgi:hypothetical protein
MFGDGGGGRLADGGNLLACPGPRSGGRTAGEVFGPSLAPDPSFCGLGPPQRAHYAPICAPLGWPNPGRVRDLVLHDELLVAEQAELGGALGCFVS